MRSPLRTLLILSLFLVPVGGTAGEGDGIDGMLPTGEVFRYAPTGHDYRGMRDPVTGRKALVGPDGIAHETVEAAVLAEEKALSALRRAVHPSLWSAVEDAARAEETLRVFLVLRDNPLPAAMEVERARIAPAVGGKIARLREMLARIASERAADVDGTLQLGHRLEEEARLLTAAEREEARGLRREVHDLMEEARVRAFGMAAPIVAAALEPVEAAVRGIPGARVGGRAVVLQAVAVEVPAGSVEGLLRARPEIRLVLPQGTRRVGLSVSVPTIGASSWTGAGYDGSSSTKVAVLDTGVDSAHPAFSGVLAAQAVWLQTGQNIAGFADDASSTDDIFGHGTHCAGIVASQDATQKGVAPGGKVLNGKCGYRLIIGANTYGNLEDADIMAAADWAVGQGASVMSCSFGGGGTTDGSNALSLFFDAVVESLGIPVAVAAGNSGPTAGTVGIPGDAFDVVTVGAFNDNNTATQTDNSISSFSSRGPLSDGRRKPDLAAPGSQINSCSPTWEGGNPDFVSWDGTSMATPHVAGALAILDDYASTWRPEGSKALLLGTVRNAAPYPVNPNDDWGTGGLNLAAAFTARAAVVEGTFTSTAGSVTFLRAPSLASGQRATLCWSREVLSNGSAAPTTYRAPADLDMYLYEESDGTTRGSSTSSLDSVEQVKCAPAAVFPIVKVKRFGSFPAGQSALHWALATETTTAAQPVSPPALACSYTTFPSFAGAGQSFTVAVTVANSGGLQATTPSVALTLPAGFTVTAGGNPQILGTIPVADSRTATWTVQAPATGEGSKAFSATATSVSFEETFASAAAGRSLTLDADGPTCDLVVEPGRSAVATSAVQVQVLAGDTVSGVADVRLRNQGGAWDAWQPWAVSFPWTLEAGEGTRVVEGQARDVAGNLSAVAAGSILVDATAPSGSFQVQGGAAYVLPWEDLVADLLPEDGAGGSGVTAFRHRWGTGTLSGWSDLDGGTTAPLARPASHGPMTVHGQFRDAAENVSGFVQDAVHVVESDPPSLTTIASWKGALAPGGDVDAFTVDAVAGDVLTLAVSGKPPVKGADVALVLDLFDPEGAKTSVPVDSKTLLKGGLKKRTLEQTGTWWIVVSADGPDAPAGAALSVSAKIASPPGNRRREGTAEPVDGVATIPFDASTGSSMKATLRGTVTGPVMLLGPDGETLLVSVSGGVVVPSVIDRGTGSYAFLVPSSGPVGYRIDLKPPKRGKAVEGTD